MRAAHPTTYLAIVLATTLLSVALVIIFNAVIDPFAMYHTVEVAGFNAYKPTIFNRMRLFKAFEVRRVKPRTLILGSSRTHVGLRCSHVALKALEEPCYSLAFDGATAKEMYVYLRHAQAIRPLKHVIL